MHLNAETMYLNAEDPFVTLCLLGSNEVKKNRKIC